MPLTKKSQLNKEKNILISVSLVDDAEMQRLNKKYKGKDYPTDVLSFTMDENHDNEFYLGDVIVNKEQADRQAVEYGNNVEEEISELVGHGVLHLLGVHHDHDQ
jgi:probable rRNA maturation factor